MQYLVMYIISKNKMYKQEMTIKKRSVMQGNANIKTSVGLRVEHNDNDISKLLITFTSDPFLRYGTKYEVL